MNNFEHNCIVVCVAAFGWQHAAVCRGFRGSQDVLRDLEALSDNPYGTQELADCVGWVGGWGSIDRWP